MSHYTQDNLLMTVLTPLGKNTLLFKSLQGEEQISGLFHFRIEMLSHETTLNFDDIVNQNITVKVEFAPDHVRYFNGIVTRFVQSGTDIRFTTYHAEIRPWLWQLTLTKNCRIFQNRTVREIITQVFEDFGFKDYRFSLIHRYEKRVYCVQYEETAFHFVSRLMEDEGMFYFFEHHENKHVLVIGDHARVHKPCLGISTVRVWEVTQNIPPTPGYVVSECHFAQKMTPGKYAIDDFNFETPRRNLKNSVDALPEQKGSEMRIYEYDAGFDHVNQGEKKVTKRIEAYTADHKSLEGQGFCFSFTTGYQFTLTQHPRRDLNAKYVLR